MKKLLITVLVLTSCIHVVSGNGDIVSETRDVSNFDSIDVCCGWDIELIQGDEESVTIRGDSNILDDIRARVRNGTLEIEYEEWHHHYEPTRTIEVTIELQELERFEGSGGVDVVAEALTGDDLEFDLSGGSSLEADVVATTLDLEVSGGGDARLDGIVTSGDVHLSGGSTLRGAGLKLKRLDAGLSGGSIATVWVVRTLEAHLSGGSILHYFGSPSVEVESSGGSHIESLGDR